MALYQSLDVFLRNVLPNGVLDLFVQTLIHDLANQTLVDLAHHRIIVILFECLLQGNDVARLDQDVHYGENGTQIENYFELLVSCLYAFVLQK